MKKKLKYLSIIVLNCMFSMSFAQKSVVLDNFYNMEIQPETGKPFHYLWSDTTMNGFSQLGELFRAKGAMISTLKEKPNKTNLKVANVYIIVDPDTKLETKDPNYMDNEAATEIAHWVKNGGVLLMLANDTKNTELDSFNTLAARFGIKFNELTLHAEKSEKGKPRNFNSCASTNLPDHPLFKGISKIFLKEIASIDCVYPAKPILIEDGQILIAEAKFGNGFVIAVGDPWLYNEYIDHLVLPCDFENLKAANNLVSLLLKEKK